MIAALLLSLQGVPATPPAPPVPVGDPDAITVEGLRIPGESDPTIKTVTVSPNSRVTAVAIRQVFEYSRRMAKCATGETVGDRDMLSAVVDGRFGERTQLIAQDRLVRHLVACHEGQELLAFDIPKLGQSIYDRGALMIEAIHRYAPDLKLTRADTGDAEVQSRFNEREMPRNAVRLPLDYRYFEAAVCMVRIQPTLAVRLVNASPGSKRQKRLSDAIVNGARICVGNAKTVFFDQTQFRIYIADAVYRWAVAARGVPSLIPQA